MVVYTVIPTEISAWAKFPLCPYILHVQLYTYSNCSKHMYCKRTYGLGSQCRPNECLFGSRKPQGVGISGRRPDGRVSEIQGSVYEQPKEEVDGSCHNKEGSK